MKKPLQISLRWQKVIMRTFIGSFIILTITIFIWIFSVWQTGLLEKINNLELHGEVTSITQPDTHNTKWWVATMTGSDGIVLEDEMLGVLQKGDSIFKKKGEDFYIMKKKGTGETRRIRMIQP